MKSYQMLQKQTTGSPRNPKIGQLWHEPFTRTMRVWNGKLWRETTGKEIAEMLSKHGSMGAWMRAETEGKQ